MYQDVEYWIKLKVDLFAFIPSITKNDNKTPHEFKAIWNCLGFYVEDTICEMEYDSNMQIFLGIGKIRTDN
jgi:hypothetical protein